MCMDTQELEISYIPTSEIKTNPRNARTHTNKQTAQIAASIKKFGFTNPVLVDENKILIAGHGRLAAAQLLEMASVPTICLAGMSDTEKRALMLADNKIALNAGWDFELLSEELELLSTIDINFDISVTGFETPEIDSLLISSDEEKNQASDPLDSFEDANRNQNATTQLGDIWHLGDHRIICGNALEAQTYERLLDGELVELALTDPPYNVPIRGHVSGLGKVKHREFAMASGEMSSEAFTSFLSDAFDRIAANSIDGAIVMSFMDWRHISEITQAGQKAFTKLKNVVVWDKVNGGMGSLYRSQHELVFVFKSGTGPHVNNIELGRHGRYRTNVWRYPGAAMFRQTRDADLAMHPTVKPVGLIADAIKDCSRRQALILDPFAGSGTILLAAERTGRRARTIELDPHYVDVAISRWQAMTGQQAVLSETGATFAEVAQNRSRALQSEEA